MKIWVDDLRPAPVGYIWYHSVNEAISGIEFFINSGFWDDFIEVIDLDYDAGDYYTQGGDYIEILNWLETMKLDYPIHLHTMNLIGRQNMRRIIEANGWEEIY